MTRRSVFGIFVATAVLAAGVGWVAGQRIRSPAELAAEAEPPDPSLITVPVELRTLSSSVVTRGDITFSEATDLIVEASTVGATIVTGLPKTQGDELSEGDVGIEVAGRPVFVLQGVLPTFRSFTPGLEGPDVEQLEQALARLGFDPGQVDGRYTAETEVAVGALYEGAGYAANVATPDEVARLSAARERVRLARVSLRDSEADLNEATRGLLESERLSYEARIAEAENRVADAEVRVAGTESPEYQLMQDAASVLQAAKKAADVAAAQLESAESGVDLDGDEAPSPERLAELRNAVEVADVAAASAEVAYETEVAAFERAQARLTTDLEAARRDLQIAEAQYREATAGQPTSGLQRRVDSARSELTTAETDLTDLDAEVGVSFPAAEVVFLPSLPREVQRVLVEVGDALSGPVMTVTGAGIQVDSEVSADDRRLLVVGLTARLIDEGLGIDGPATLSYIADEAGTEGLPAARYRIRLVPDEALPEDAFLANVRVIIPVESTGGDVLAVPLAAVSAASDGSARVQVERQQGSTELVTVRIGLSADGYVAVEPIDANLVEGDRVVVGSEGDG